MNPYRVAKVVSLVKLAIGVALMVSGFVLAKTATAGPVGFVLATVGTILSAKNFSLVVRIIAAEQQLKRGPRTQNPRERQRDRYEQSTLPLRIFALLHAVAEADGQADARERDLVQRFLFLRFPQPDLASVVRSWRLDPLSGVQLAALTRELQAMLHAGECEMVFSWCCSVSLIDRKFSDIEHEVLQDVAQNLGITKHHARRIFLHSKNRILNERRQSDQDWSNANSGSRAGSGSRTGSGSGAGYGSQRPRGGAMSPRRRALEVLGLEDGASTDEVRKRHRELAKKYHPDAHTQLGAVAAEEAKERFLEIQEAYELLSS